MRKLRQDLQSHKRAAMLLLMYWVATLVVIPFTWNRGIPLPVVALLFTTPVIVGVLVGWWRASAPESAALSSDRISGGMLAGGLIAVITVVVMKGGAIDEVVGWLHGHKFQGGEVIGFAVAAGICGMLLGGAGAMLAMRMDRFRHHASPTPSA